MVASAGIILIFGLSGLAAQFIEGRNKAHGVKVRIPAKRSPSFRAPGRSCLRVKATPPHLPPAGEAACKVDPKGRKARKVTWKPDLCEYSDGETYSPTNAKTESRKRPTAYRWTMGRRGWEAAKTDSNKFILCSGKPVYYESPKLEGRVGKHRRTGSLHNILFDDDVPGLEDDYYWL